MTLSEVLQECGLLDQDAVTQVQNDPKSREHGFIRRALELGILDEEALVRAFSKRFRLPILDLDQIEINPKLLAPFSFKTMKDKLFLPVAQKGLPGKESLIVAFIDAADTALIAEVEKRARCIVRWGFARPSQILSALSSMQQVAPEKELKGSIKMGDDSEITELTHQPFDGDDAGVLDALTEPTHHGFRLNEGGDLPSASTAFSKPISDSTKGIDGDLNSLLRETNKSLLLNGLIELLIQKKVFSLEEFLAAMELKK